MGLFDKLFGTYSQRELKHIYPIRDKVLALDETYAAMSDADLRAMTPKLKDRLAAGETLDDILPDAFAVCREAAQRVLGMKHYPVQIIGGIVLHQGRIAEMKTGEGKTLVATLPAYLNGLSGKGVHIVTVNDYLAKRDSEWMGKLYNYLGLSVGLIISGMDNAAKKKAYACDIIYGTNNEFGFDYLRDNMVTYKENQVQRGHAYAIVDEVDSILIDEARTPLIISGQGDKSTDLYEIADKFARTLTMTKVKELDDKQDNDDIEGDYIVDEKARTCTLTPEGVRKAEKYFNLENLTDPENMTISHHINQAIRAHGIMKRDIDYVVKDGEVIIVDEFTGRLMIGRRYNEGLHQAIEAKEGVTVARESKTLATITFQNYFRMYKKLAGMTGTALTEENEFREIYKLDVIEIPTNRPIQRIDMEDVIYKTEDGKFNAVIEQIIECHNIGQPVLVGTVSIEKSEHLSSMLRRRGIKHEVLNAKYHEKEAEIVAQAGKFGAVTIATNMAGRGTDIMLGGNAEYLAKADLRKLDYSDELIAEAEGYSNTDDEEILAAREKFRELLAKHKEEIKGEAEKVRDAGGLFIIGTERHESRRIDNQLRGRSGRQGDPGKTRFFLSLEDDLMRLFGGDRIQNLMDTLKIEDDMPIEAKLLSGTIESAQSKVEGRNFAIRKNVLQFDDVMNRQREIIYGQREKVLDGEDLGEIISKMVDDVVSEGVARYLPEGVEHKDWNLSGLREYFRGWITTEDDLRFDDEALQKTSREEITQQLTEKAHELYASREEKFSSNIMRELERIILLKNVDSKWMDHIDAMDELKKGIYLRSYGQKDPVVEYRIEGFEMFDELIASIREDTVKMLLTVQIRTSEPPKREQVAKPLTTNQGDGTVKSTPAKKGHKVGRNDPCPCGSGKKYKKCCGKDE
ncbi:preprotein translocase subunit SecA [Merdimmobilis hominis]|jgi:preprotein translocase subunit SecA|uniref:Protein translocase subunit SecA n=1 Tax=uncultured Anaerotruncus sp. TaxID=905011 RepID=A0A6N2UG27_9FIRM|nr:preprotein translocase subunit SecA [Merdimmobilis hominis]MCD4835356.1 preprotein translocase subunit SecA [Merdimmobilis hominis]PWL62958.1 MAG: preprotein translocase subunit SecA [Oscillospiraceae bacterium]